jgi:thiol-disulfide isomerase/thioredoxin
MKKTSLILTLCLALLAPLYAKPLMVRDINSTARAIPDRRATVLLFTGTDCKFSTIFAPELKRIAAKYGKQFTFYAVYPEPDSTTAQIRKHAQEFGLPFPVLRDSNKKLTNLTGATVTPEAVVLSPAGKVLYRGRIDNRYITYAQKRPQPTQYDLANALDAIAKGKTPLRTRTQALGCFIY